MRILLPVVAFSALALGSALDAQSATTSRTLGGISPTPLVTGRATGTLDQVSPFASEAVYPPQQGAWFNGDANFLIWQTEVRAGMSGLLEGFEIECSGNPGASIDLRIRLGGGWNTNAAVWTGNYTKSTSSTEIGWLDTSSAGINLSAGQLFVIEWQGTGTGLGITGTYVPPPGTPAYPELIYLLGPGCYADCGWRIGFHTYMGGGGPQLSVLNLVGGQRATLDLTGGTPLGPVVFAYSLAGGGPTSVSAGGCGVVTVALTPPIVQLPTAFADAAGHASFSGTVPPGASGAPIWFHAFDVLSCSLSNPIAAVIG